MPSIDLSVVPSVIHRDGPREYHTDIYSRMLKERVIFLTGPVHDQMADLVIAQLLYLESESPTSDVQVYINSPGGSVSAGLAIHDVMQMLRCDVVTHCVGQAASMGAFLLAAGTPGKRYALQHARVMIHQPLIGGGGITGQATDVLLHAAEMKRTRDTLDGLLSGYTGKPLKIIRRDTERDNFMSALEAKNYGLIDHVLTRQDRPK